MQITWTRCTDRLAAKMRKCVSVLPDFCIKLGQKGELDSDISPFNHQRFQIEGKSVDVGKNVQVRGCCAHTSEDCAFACNDWLPHTEAVLRHWKVDGRCRQASPGLLGRLRGGISKIGWIVQQQSN